MRLNIYGDYFGQTGYSQHTRGLCLGLQQAGHELNIESSTLYL